MINSHTRAVTKNKENKLQTKKPYQILTGRVIGHRDGFGFMQRDVSEPEGDDVFLPAHTLRHVLHGDTVRVQVIGIDPRGRLEGEVLEVLEHRTRSVVGRLLQEKGQWLVVPEDQRLKHDIYIDAKDTGTAVSGQVVVVTITQYSTDTGAAQGIVTELLGEVDDPGMEIEIAVRKFDVPHVFSEAALTLADDLPSTVQAVDLIDRVDLRDINLLTIDGEDARDFDDAVYCEPIGDQANQGWRLLVAIADVSHYIRNGNALDVDAQERTTSVYFPRRVIPMLPEKISNGLCSLMPKVDRLCMVADMVISKEGSIDAYQFYPAVMHSAARLTYNQVWEALSESKVSKKNSNPAYAVLPELHHLYAVFQAFLSTRKQRGAIEFETTETYFISNEAGKIERIEARTRNDAHRLIEECMLAANVCAANMLTTHKQAALYRVHEGPTPPKLEALREYLKNLGLQLGGGDSPKATDYASLMQIINAREDAQALQSIVLRSMQQAVYTPDNVGHFGLSYEAYAHFTSPIRRYPDLLVHRAIKAILAGYSYSPTQTAADPVISLHKKKKDVPQTAKLSTKNNLHTPLTSTEQKNHNAWVRLGILCSAYERRADEASRDVESWLKCQYMQQYMGDFFSGVITGVANFGLFVTLDGLYVEGTVHITELGAEYFQHIEATHELRGSKTGKRYTVGQTVHVQVARVDLEARRIELKLTQTDIALKVGHLKIKPPLSSNVIQDSQSNQTKVSKRTKNIVKTAIKIAKKAVDSPTLNIGVATKKVKKLTKIKP
ncbi:MAG: RNase 3-5 exoribonuclease [Pseudomonadota bacterium]|jgi:ribonuclease R